MAQLGELGVENDMYSSPREVLSATFSFKSEFFPSNSHPGP